jgi:hypothetical protein
MEIDMTFEELFGEWKKDSDIDPTDLGNESLKIPKLHHKYYMHLVQERASLRKLESQYKQLKLAKFEFYSQGHTEETRALGWQLPPRGIILKAEIPTYIESDKDIIDLSLRIGVQQEKVDFLESIIKSFQTRGYLIKNSIDYMKFQMGG